MARVLAGNKSLLTRYLAAVGCQKDEILYMVAALWEEEATLEMLEFCKNNPNAAQGQILEAASRIRQKYKAEEDSKQELADSFADASDRFWDFEDNMYDFEADTPEFEAACAEAKRLYTIMNDYEKKILDLLATEGIEIPEKDHIKVLSIFMERYGYVDAGGWWVRKELRET